MRSYVLLSLEILVIPVVLTIGFIIYVRWEAYRFKRMTPDERREFNKRREGPLNVGR